MRLMSLSAAVLGIAQQRSQAVIDIGLKKTEQVHDTVVVNLSKSPFKYPAKQLRSTGFNMHLHEEMRCMHFESVWQWQQS